MKRSLRLLVLLVPMFCMAQTDKVYRWWEPRPKPGPRPLADLLIYTTDVQRCRDTLDSVARHVTGLNKAFMVYELPKDLKAEDRKAEEDKFRADMPIKLEGRLSTGDPIRDTLSFVEKINDLHYEVDYYVLVTDEYKFTAPIDLRDCVKALEKTVADKRKEIGEHTVAARYCGTEFFSFTDNFSGVDLGKKGVKTLDYGCVGVLKRSDADKAGLPALTPAWGIGMYHRNYILRGIDLISGCLYKEYKKSTIEDMAEVIIRGYYKQGMDLVRPYQKCAIRVAEHDPIVDLYNTDRAISRVFRYLPESPICVMTRGVDMSTVASVSTLAFRGQLHVIEPVQELVNQLEAQWGKSRKRLQMHVTLLGDKNTVTNFLFPGTVSDKGASYNMVGASPLPFKSFPDPKMNTTVNRKVTEMRLDDWCALDNIKPEKGDHLKVDALWIETLGYEDRILEGAKRQLADSIKCVCTTVCNKEIHPTAPSLDDLKKQLGEHGFVLIARTYGEDEPPRSGGKAMFVKAGLLGAS